MNLRRQNRTTRELRPIVDLETHDQPTVRMRQVTAYFDVDERTVAKWIETGLIEGVIKMPGKSGWRIPTAALRAFVKRHTMGQPAPV